MTACVLATDVVIAALDRRDAHHERAAAAVLALIDAEAPRLLSTVNYAEALARPAEDERTLRRAVDAIAALGIRLVSPSAEIARAAARYRALGISLADGFRSRLRRRMARRSPRSTDGCDVGWDGSESRRRSTEPTPPTESHRILLAPRRGRGYRRG